MSFVECDRCEATGLLTARCAYYRTLSNWQREELERQRARHVARARARGKKHAKQMQAALRVQEQLREQFLLSEAQLSAAEVRVSKVEAERGELWAERRELLADLRAAEKHRDEARKNFASLQTNLLPHFLKLAKPRE